MSLARDLLEQAEHLARMEPTRPKQASLRRAVSAAYYALFHQLVRDTASFLVHGSASHKVAIRQQLERAFEHSTMAKAAAAFVRGDSPWLGANPTVSTNTRDVAQAFFDTQRDRHDADYSRRRFFRSEVLGTISRCRDALDRWKGVRLTPEGHAFMVALLGTRVR